MHQFMLFLQCKWWASRFWKFEYFWNKSLHWFWKLLFTLFSKQKFTLFSNFAWHWCHREYRVSPTGKNQSFSKTAGGNWKMLSTTNSASVTQISLEFQNQNFKISLTSTVSPRKYWRHSGPGMGAVPRVWVTALSTRLSYPSCVADPVTVFRPHLDGSQNCEEQRVWVNWESYF